MTNTLTLFTQQASPSAKIALFRSLFKGREDLYPQRFESPKTGKAGDLGKHLDEVLDTILRVLSSLQNVKL